nr:hypothetical protein Iba_chr02aCG7630 [Ipomoea batatas]
MAVVRSSKMSPFPFSITHNAAMSYKPHKELDSVGQSSLPYKIPIYVILLKLLINGKVHDTIEGVYDSLGNKMSKSMGIPASVRALVIPDCEVNIF